MIYSESPFKSAERASVLPVGMVLGGESGRAYTVLSLISNETGQGNIYLVRDELDFYALKLFFKREGDPENRLVKEQIERLMARGKACDVFVHPLDIIHHEGRIGYIMEYIDPGVYVDGIFLVNGMDGDIQNQMPFAVKLTAMYQLSHAMATLFQANLAMMDLKFDNIKVNPATGDIRIMDVDTIVANGVTGFVSGTLGFMPPNIMRYNEASDRYADCFALAVMIFYTFFRFHPLEGRAEESLPPGTDPWQYLYTDHPVYVFHPFDDSNRPTDACALYAGRYERYPDYFKLAFERTFVDGLFDQKTYRTYPDEWCELLERLYEESYFCPVCYEEHFISGGGGAVCEVCGAPLVRPLLLSADKSIPLFLGSEISERSLWFDAPDTPLFRVVKTEYSGKFGLEVLASDLHLYFPDGTSRSFRKGETAPLFLGVSYGVAVRRFDLVQV